MLRGENEEAPASEGLQSSSPLQRQSLETSRDVGNYPKSRKGLERRIVSGCAELGVLPEKKRHILGLRGFLLEFTVLWSRSRQHRSWWCCRALVQVLEMVLYPRLRSCQLFKET